MPFTKCEGYQQLKTLPADEKLAALLSLAKRVNHYELYRRHYHTEEYKRYAINSNLLDALMRTRIDFPTDFSFLSLFELFYQSKDTSIDERPLGAFAMQIEKHVKKHSLNEILCSDIGTILQKPVFKKYLNGEAKRDCWGPDIGKALQKLQQLMGQEAQRPQPYVFSQGRLGKLIKADINALATDIQDRWFSLFHHLAKASGGKPSKKFINSSKPLIDAIGTRQFKTKVNQWLQASSQLEVIAITHTHSYNQKEYTYESHEYIESQGHDLLKGLLWSMSRFHDQKTLQNIAVLVEKCFQKIPGIGLAAAGVGNAGIYTLAQSKGLTGISHLSRLKLRIRQSNTQKLIQKYIDEQAQNLGIKAAQIEELSTPDFDLNHGERLETFDEYQLQIKLTGIGSTSLQWLKADGKPQKSVPALVKNTPALAAKLKKIRDIAKQIKQASTTQRDRIDRLYGENMSWNMADFSQYYLHHGLVSQIAQRLIWTLDGKPALYVNEQWQDHDGKALEVAKAVVVRLWHPLESEANIVLAWRERLEALQIQQPLKQAYREIYLLTDAEINTRIYSNRMAAHILKQHQFNSLAALRGWKYSLLGAYDDGRDGEIASKNLPEYGLTAQFWIDEIIDDTDSFNEAGIWLYVATDQVRFCKTEDDNEAIPLTDVPPLILSEMMRDVDLFVGVASVGNDPQWQDGGPDARPAYRDYWHSYSFGDLTEVAKTRKTVLERLIPRLKIRDVAHIEGKFLWVKGKKHTYKIHIGSGNILIAPHDRYLCIVPGRSKDKQVEQVFLPFEGDHGLSIVLSKAFLLAADDKITDATILSQL